MYYFEEIFIGVIFFINLNYYVIIFGVYYE